MKSVQIRSFFWSLFFRIRTEYGEIIRIFLYSVRMRKNIDSNDGLFLRSTPLFEVQRLFEPRRLLKEIRYVWKKSSRLKNFSRTLFVQGEILFWLLTCFSRMLKHIRTNIFPDVLIKPLDQSSSWCVYKTPRSIVFLMCL